MCFILEPSFVQVVGAHQEFRVSFLAATVVVVIVAAAVVVVTTAAAVGKTH